MRLAEIGFNNLSTFNADVAEVDVDSDRIDRVNKLDETVDGSDEILDNYFNVIGADDIGEVCEHIEYACNRLVENFVNSVKESLENRIEGIAVVCLNRGCIFLLSRSLGAEELKKRDNSIVVTVAAHDSNFFKSCNVLAVMFAECFKFSLFGTAHQNECKYV